MVAVFAFNRIGLGWFKLWMDGAALGSADKETLILLVLTQAEAISSLTRQVEILTARVAELEARLGLPPKTPDNSGTPPSHGRKSSSEEAQPSDKRKAHPGAHRLLHPNPTSRREVMASACQHCGADVSGVPQMFADFPVQWNADGGLSMSTVKVAKSLKRGDVRKRCFFTNRNSSSGIVSTSSRSNQPS